MTGRVLSWNPTGRYAWIRPDAGRKRKDFFAHIDDVVGATELVRGQTVEFAPTATPRGLRAVHVKVVELAPRAAVEA